jgi:hypothetical protein
VSEEALQVEFDILLLLAVDQREDEVRSTVSILPFLHLEGVLKLHMAHVKELSGALFVFKRDWVGNL